MTIKLAVTARDVATDASTVRSEGGVPAVVYGPKQEALSITVSSKDLDKIRKEASESTIVELTGLEETHEVLIKNLEFSPVKQQVLHVDFYAIERGKDMTTTVPLEYIGEAPVEASKQGSVTRVLHEVEVTCRPSDLPGHIDVDISGLATVEDKILVQDLQVGSGVTINAEPEDAVAVVSVTKEEEEEVPEAGEVDMDAIEVEEKGKGEEASAEASE